MRLVAVFARSLFCLAILCVFGPSARGQGVIVGSITDPSTSTVVANLGFKISGDFSKSPTGGPSRDRVRVELLDNTGTVISFWNDTMDDSPVYRTDFSTNLSTKGAPIVTAGSYTI